MNHMTHNTHIWSHMYQKKSVCVFAQRPPELEELVPTVWTTVSFYSGEAEPKWICSCHDAAFECRVLRLSDFKEELIWLVLPLVSFSFFMHHWRNPQFHVGPGRKFGWHVWNCVTSGGGLLAIGKNPQAKLCGQRNYEALLFAISRDPQTCPQWFEGKHAHVGVTSSPYRTGRIYKISFKWWWSFTWGSSSHKNAFLRRPKEQHPHNTDTQKNKKATRGAPKKARTEQEGNRSKEAGQGSTKATEKGNPKPNNQGRDRPRAGHPDNSQKRQGATRAREKGRERPGENTTKVRTP